MTSRDHERDSHGNGSAGSRAFGSTAVPVQPLPGMPRSWSLPAVASDSRPFQYTVTGDASHLVLAGRAFGFTAGKDQVRDIQELRTEGSSDGWAGKAYERDSAVAAALVAE